MHFSLYFVNKKVSEVRLFHLELGHAASLDGGTFTSEELSRRKKEK